MYCFEFLIAIRMLGFLTTRHSKRITLSESPATPAQTIRLSCGCQLMCKLKLHFVAVLTHSCFAQM